MKIRHLALLLGALLMVWTAVAPAQPSVTKYVRYSVKSGPATYGILEGETIRELQGGLFDGAKPTGRTVTRSEATLLVPIDPFTAGNVIGVSDNALPRGSQKRPVAFARWFSKLPSALSTNGGDVELPADAVNLNLGGDLVLVIGKTCSRVSVAEAPSCIFGVTAGNDWTEATWYSEVGGVDQPSRYVSKAHDTWAGVHDVIYTGLDYSNLAIAVHLNGETVARGRTSEVAYDPAHLIADVTKYLTLMPGDLVYAGVAPPQVNYTRTQVRAGDTVEVEIENIGTLKQRVVPARTATVIEPATPPRPGVTRYVRYSQNGQISSGIREGDTIRQLSGDIFTDAKPTGRTVQVSNVTLLAPLDPLKIQKAMGAGSNYQQQGRPPRVIPHPRMFAKSKRLIIDGDDTTFPEDAVNFNYEGELVLVLGKKCRNVSEAQAPQCIFGVAAGNDWGDNGWRDPRLESPTRLIAKAGDSWTAIGPEIVAGADYSDLTITTRYNGEVAGSNSTKNMVNTPAKLVASISKYVTFMPGDVFYTGTAIGTKPTKPGDVVEIEIQNLGTLRNRIVPMKAP